MRGVGPDRPFGGTPAAELGGPRLGEPRKRPASLYERLGGMAFFEALTDRFYEGVAHDEILRPLYPEDLGPSRRHLCLFLAQFWGGPRHYEQQRGSPDLRARHMPFRIGPTQRDRWLQLMTAAVKAAGTGELEESQLISRFTAAADHIVNSD